MSFAQVERRPGLICIRLDRPAVSLVLRPRPVVVGVVVAGLAVAVAVMSVALGAFVLSLTDVVRGVGGQADQATTYIVQQVRLPRVVLALLVGAAFGLAGALMQSVTGNPLASPDVLGVSAGAGAAAVLWIVLSGGDSGGAAGVPLSVAALLGGLAAAALIFGLSWRRGFASNRLILVGIGTAAALTALTSLLLARADVTDAQRGTAWLVGSLNGRGWPDVVPLALTLAVCVPLALVVGRALRTLRLGDGVAIALGTRVTLVRAALILLAVALAAVATAAAGPIGFVGLLAPQVAARLTRTSEIPLTASSTAGALIVVGADLIARLAPLEASLPVGAVTAVLGGPALLYLLHRTPRTRS